MIEVEKENFRVDSTGWEQRIKEGITYLESPIKDIWEYVAGVNEELIGQQLFTWDAAMRETEKAGKRMPSDEEWATIIENYNEINGALKKEAEQFPFVGYRSGINGPFNKVGSYGVYRSSSIKNIAPYYLGFTSVSVSPACNDYRTYGFSVRCLND